MKRIVIVLISSLLVFAATLLFTNQYILHRARATADMINDHLLEDFSTDFNLMQRTASSAVYSFMSGNYFKSQQDTTTGHFYIRNQDIPNFSQAIAGDLRDFLSVNPLMSKAVVLVDDSVSHYNTRYGLHRGFSVIVNRLGEEEHVLSNYDFMHSASYNKVKTSGQGLWTLPSRQSPVYGKSILYFSPIYCEDSKFFGTLAIHISIDSIYHRIVTRLPYGEEQSAIVLYDAHDEVISSYPADIDSTRYSGDEYLLYERQIPMSGWRVLTACHRDAVYSEVYRIRWIIFATSFVGMLLMMACCIVISRQLRRDFHRKAMAEQEIAMAAQVQSSILKAPHCEVGQATLDAFIRPARETGGDLYGYDVQSDRLIFCIGDVSGKGMSAALFMTQVLSLFRQAVRHSAAPEVIVGEMNNVLTEDNPNMTFCTFFVGVLVGNTLTYCNAGHNPPLLLPRQDFPRFLTVRPNLSLGLMEDYPYRTESMQLQPGDRLLLYTDGVTEAKDCRHQEFKAERLLECLAQGADDPIRTAMGAVEQFVGTNEQSDDITLLLVSAK